VNLTGFNTAAGGGARRDTVTFLVAFEGALCFRFTGLRM
jgi:hypothetical protein